MNKHNLLFAIVSLLLLTTACQNKNQINTPAKYVYQETVKLVNNKPILLEGEEAETLVQRTPDTIEASNDEAAYLTAYGRLCASSLFYAMLNEDRSTHLSYPQSFTLTDSKGTDIVPTIDFPDRKAKEDKIWQTHLDLEKTINKKDSVRLNKLAEAIQVRL